MSRRDPMDIAVAALVAIVVLCIVLGGCLK